MELTLERFGVVGVVTVEADAIEAGNVKAFKDKLLALCDQETRLALDLTRVRFVDSSGLGAMLSGLRRVHGRGGDLRLCGLAPPVRALFELVRMHRVFEIHNSRDEAVRSYA